MKRFLVLLAALMCMGAASDPAERLPDPEQEARARALFQEIRCVVCQNESIDDSEAEIAQDLRRIVREQVSAGRSDDEVRSYLVERYGEFVLFKPSFSPGNAALWLTPAVILLMAGGWLLWRARKAAPETAAPALSAEEEARLAALTQPDDGGHAFAATSPPEKSQDDRSVS